MQIINIVSHIIIIPIHVLYSVVIFSLHVIVAFVVKITLS